MYLHNKYYTIYYEIVNRARNRELIPGVYYEKHHIIPKSLGGSNNSENLVHLHPKEHYICHRLLTKITIGEQKQKMIYAVYMMMRGIKRFKPTASVYEKLRNQMREANKNRVGPNKGKNLSDIWKKKIKDSFTAERRAQISDLRKGNPTRKKGSFTVSQETRDKIAQSRKGKPTRFGPHTEETKQKLKESRSKQIFTEETFKKRSESMKGRPKSEEHNLKNSLSHKGKIQSEETKRKISETLKAKYAKNK